MAPVRMVHHIRHGVFNSPLVHHSNGLFGNETVSGRTSLGGQFFSRWLEAAVVPDPVKAREAGSMAFFAIAAPGSIKTPGCRSLVAAHKKLPRISPGPDGVYEVSVCNWFE